MSWNGKSFGKPLILVDYRNLQETVTNNKFKRKGIFRKEFSETQSTEDIFVHLQKEKKFGDCCKYLAYTIHKRVGIWWAYQCIVLTNNEIDKAKKIALEAGAAKKKKLADLSKYHDPELEEAIKKQKQNLADTMKKHEELVKKLDFSNLVKNPYSPKNEIQKEFLQSVNLKGLHDAMKKIQDTIDSLNPKEKAEYFSIKQHMLDELQKKNGGDSLRDAFQGALTHPNPIPKTGPSLVDKAETRLRAKHESVKKTIDEEMKSIFPLKLSGLPEPTPKEDIVSALQSVHHWIVAPTDINAKNALNAGKKAGSSMEGLLALSAFWAHGNLSIAAPVKTPEIVTTPAGLVSQGIDSVLLKASMAEDLELSSDEMYEMFFKIGIESAQGINLWDTDFLKSLHKTNFNGNNRTGFGRVYAKPEENGSF
jgi:hypothetical protein